MARAQPSSPVHLIEVGRTRNRFWLAVVLLVIGISTGIVAERVTSSKAATITRVSGRVYNKTTGQGYSNVTISFCNTNGSSVTASNGTFYKDMAQNTGYCARVTRFPYSTQYLSGPKAPNNNPTIGSGQSSYESQIAGANCYKSSYCAPTNQQWDRNFSTATADTGTDFVYTSLPTPAPTPKPTPVPTPKPTATPAPAPAPVPTATPRPPGSTPRPPSGSGGTKTPTPGSGAGSGAVGAGTPTNDSLPPTTPAGFQATVSDDNAIVALSWSGSSDDVGLAGYTLERSLDRATWSQVGPTLVATTYNDTAVGFGVHYYYRLSAVDLAGNRSDYATADVTTGSFSANSGGSDGSTYTSDDNLVTVRVPGAALPGEADCSLNPSADGTKKPGTAEQPLVAGPYMLVCKTLDGLVVSQYLKPLEWTVNLKGKLKGLHNPAAYFYDGNDTASVIKTAKYDPKTSLLTFTTTSNGKVAVLAYVVHGISPSVVVMIVVVLMILAGLVVLVLRRRQRSNYDEYLRSKYYNL